MASVGKCLGIVAGGTFLAGAGLNCISQSRMNKKVLANLPKTEDGKIRIGGRTPDGKMWDGVVGVDEVKKDMRKAKTVSSLLTGLFAAIGATAVAGLTLLLKAKIK